VIHATLSFLGFQNIRDFVLQDDGSGPYVSEWRSTEPQPTPEQIEAARHPAALAVVTERIRQDCERRQFTQGVPFAGVRWQSDEKSRGRYAFLMGFAQITLMSGGTMASPISDPATQQPVVWNAMGGVQVPLTVGLLLGMLQAAAARENACDATYRAHVVAAALLDDPLTYDFSAGWPE
jgi:hypothetical protein